MERINLFRDCILSILKEEADYYKGETNPLNLIVIADEKGHHYQLLMQGWQADRYVFQCLLHLDIIDGKIWIQWNETELAIENELLKAGVRPDEVVIGRVHPGMRKYGDFALG
ncbi:MAG: element excision factor XisI family protein [Bacteroidota bacterium]